MIPVVLGAMRRLSSQVDRRVHRERAAESRASSLGRMLRENNRAAGHWQSELRVEGLRRKRAEATERNELFADYQYARAQQEQEKKNQLTDLQERIANQLEQKKILEVREAVNKQRICDGSEELRALKSKLQAASVNKERAVQLVERQAQELADHLREERICEHLEKQRQEDIEKSLMAEREKAKQLESIQSTQRQQIKQKELLLYDAEMQQQHEREAVEQVAAQIAMEDQAEFEMRKAKQGEIQRHIVWSRHDREKQEKESERREAEESANIEAFAQRKRAFEDRLAKQKEQQDIEKQRILQKMISEQEAKQQEARDFEKLQQDLYEQELEEARRQRDQEVERRRLADREQRKRDYQQDLRRIEEKRLKHEAEQEAFREQLMIKLAEDDKIEQMNAQKRRMRVQQHKREVERQLDERRALYEEERRRELEELKRKEAEDLEHQRIIEDERQRLLIEHAAPMRDFLPKGVLDRESDLAFLGGAEPAPKPEIGMSSETVGARGPRRAWSSPAHRSRR